MNPESSRDRLLLAALEPVLDWYQPDEEHPRDPIEIVRDAVADLKRDRAIVIRCENFLRQLAKERDARSYGSNEPTQNAISAQRLLAANRRPSAIGNKPSASPSK